jgi:hypothetical protein
VCHRAPRLNHLESTRPCAILSGVKAIERGMYARGRGGAAIACWLLASASLGCEEEATPTYDASATCSEIGAQLRACSLLSEGVMDCRIFQVQRYGECAIQCLRPASCAEIQAQTCDDVDNAYALCLDRCQAIFSVVECGDGQSVDIDSRCDGEPDCANGADELDCAANAATFACGGGEFVSLEDDRCDGVEDCSNGRDEVGCPMRAETICPGGF